MAFIVACHESPKVDKQELLVPAYVLLFTKFDEVQKWQFVQEFKEKGGQEFIEKMLQVVAAKKNDTKAKTLPIEPDGKSSVSVSNTSSVTRPKRGSRLTNSRKLPLTTS